jgi:segregation and condensation protein B
MVCQDVSDDPSKTPSELEIGRDYSTGVSPPVPSADMAALAARVEALLFVAPAEVGLAQLASALEVTSREIELALEWLDGAFEQRGMQIQRSNRSVQLTTAPSMASDIERFLELEETSRLSRAALEVLAIIAYQQPVTRPQIDSIRGVNSDSVLRTLLRHGLVEEVGRTEAPGRPILYSTTTEFLSHFGLASRDELPPLNLDLHSVTPAEETTDERADEGAAS